MAFVEKVVAGAGVGRRGGGGRVSLFMKQYRLQSP